nr:LOW QUALITY PROTEIN: zwei Ig domain protein zig-8-like [Cherax quadricarinatus]
MYIPWKVFTTRRIYTKHLWAWRVSAVNGKWCRSRRRRRGARKVVEVAGDKNIWNGKDSAEETYRRKLPRDARLGGVGVGVGVADGRRGKAPEFGRAEETVTVEEGDTATLPCLVYHLNDRAVTWLRRRDLHILTAGHHTYSADDRFQMVHTEGSNEWTLVVRYAQERDAGVYECQVNTDPKLSRPVTLNVLGTVREVSVAKTKVFVANNTASTKDGQLRVEIQGPRELYIEEGSSLSLTCLVTSSHGPSTPVYWYHDTNLIDYNSPRGGVNLKIDQSRGETITRLVVSAVGPGDSGMYSCVPPGSHPATVRVHVQKGDHEAAIQQGGLDDTAASSSSTHLLPGTHLSFLYFLFLLFLSSPSLFHDLQAQFMGLSLLAHFHPPLLFPCLAVSLFIGFLPTCFPRFLILSASASSSCTARPSLLS